MKAMRLHQVDGRPESLLYEDAPKPILKDNQVLVQVYATAITPPREDEAGRVTVLLAA
jgi:NADPH:quinone reductase-like Zn-dependent oxidoreductase